MIIIVDIDQFTLVNYLVKNTLQYKNVQMYVLSCYADDGHSLRANLLDHPVVFIIKELFNMVSLLEVNFLSFNYSTIFACYRVKNHLHHKWVNLRRLKSVYCIP